MEIHDKLAELSRVVEDARAMPMSASCIVNRGEVLTLLDDVQRLLPADLARAEALLAERDRVIDLGREEAERLAEKGRAEQARLVSESAVSRDAREEAERVVEEAQREADAIKAEVDEYVDGKLANFEVVLNKTMQTITRGRARLRGLREEDALGDVDTDPAPGV